MMSIRLKENADGRYRNDITHRFLCILKGLLNSRDLAVSVLVDLLFGELLFDRHTNSEEIDRRGKVKNRRVKSNNCKKLNVAM